MRRGSFLFSLILLFAPLAYGGTPTPGGASKNPAAGTPNAATAAACSSDDFTKNPPSPAKTGTSVTSIGSTTPSVDLNSLTFKECDQMGTATNSCNLTRAVILYYYSKAAAAAKDTPGIIVGGTNQSSTITAATTAAATGAKKLTAAANTYTTLAACLNDPTDANCGLTALRITDKFGVTHESSEAQSLQTSAPLAPADLTKASTINATAPKGFSATTVTGCSQVVGATGPAVTSLPQYCDLKGAQMAAQYYAKRFTDAATCKTAAAAVLNGNASTGNGNASGLTGTTAGSALSTLMPMAQLAMMGAALACSMKMISQCKQAAQQDQSQITSAPGTDPSLSASPTAASPQASSLGNDTPGVSSPTGSDSPDSNTPVAASSPAPDYEGSAASNPLASNGNGSPFDRGLASVPMGSFGAPGGGAGAGTAGGAAALQSTNTSTGAYDPNKGGDSGAFPSGGASAPGGGFNLSSGPNAPAADNALKSALNGDPPSLGAAPDLGAGASPAAPVEQAANGEGDDTPIFTRIREATQRCMRRGCVGASLGGGKI